jgi:limonene-1,2-epoxide hydrolase
VGATQEAIVRDFMDLWGDGTQESPKIDEIVDMFSEDAAWQLWIPGGPTLKGREAIRADIARQLGFATYMRCGLIHIASNDTQVFTERLDTFLSNGTTVNHHLVAVFDVDADGKITAWREYFDSADVNRQLRAANAVVPPAAKN